MAPSTVATTVVADLVRELLLCQAAAGQRAVRPRHDVVDLEPLDVVRVRIDERARVARDVHGRERFGGKPQDEVRAVLRPEGDRLDEAPGQPRLGDLAAGLDARSRGPTIPQTSLGM